MPPVILLFAKAPVPGRVKTRLQPVLSAEECAELHASFVADVLEQLAGFSRPCQIELHTDERTDAWSEFAVARELQSGRDLGQRMWTAAHGAFLRGASQVLLLGSDAPTLPPSHIEALLDSPADIAFGPTEDGGYYAVMFRKLPPGLFDTVEWSTEYTLEQSVRQARRLGLRVDIGPAWYDVDSPADLVRLVIDTLPPRTRAWLTDHQFLKSPAPEDI